MTKRRILTFLLVGVLAGMLVCVGLLVCAGLFVAVLEITAGTDVWQRDGPPSSMNMEVLIGSRYPSSITRVVDRGMSSRFNGDGERLIIMCFSPSDVPRMKELLGHEKTWKAGLPDSPNWKQWILGERVDPHIRTTSPSEGRKSAAPADLKISPSAPPTDFIHTEDGFSYFRIIDTVRGISYRFDIHT